ncbi:hypothetical protein [Bacillus sp. CRB-7]|uniref:hypothetical protein n=1 Tax=Bacillus sp. CRB-7 TaxID=2874284 RepID=UPI001CCC19D4|nr:hypothetical protein [Bacillus sp. CRB-7]UBM53203.1 hypothetical protein K8M08_27160 [Bacillus sp. CRB-7]
MKEEDIVRRSSDSHRYKANADECKAVIDELYNYQGGKYKDFADLARMQFLSGGRRSEVIGLLDKEVHVEDKIVEFNDAKGGLDNKVWVNHWSKDDKNFVANLVRNADEDGKIFRLKNESGSIYQKKKLLKS